MSSAFDTKITLRRVLLPGFYPRFKALFASGFQYIPYFIALVYGAVRLLPAGHPYLDARNMGRFGIRHVIGEAANHIVFSRRNIDQIILFLCTLVGLGIILIQFCLLGMAFFMQPALAAMPTNFAEFFLTPAATRATDLAGMLMDLVFGVPGIFDSCVSTAVTCISAEGTPIEASVAGHSWALQPAVFPMPMHVGLHQVFQLYNLGLLVVAMFITLYFIATIILETAESGTAFGKRFNRVWAPVRIVMAFGLLVPVGYGLSSSQYIVLYAAKFGSGFATNGWNLFNDVLGTGVKNLLAAQDTTSQNLVAQPNAPEVGGLLQFLFVAKTCAEAEAAYYTSQNITIDPIKPYIVDDPFKTPRNLRIDQATTYNDVMNFVVGPPPASGNAIGKDQIIIRFGREDEKKYGFELGWVSPICGELVMRLSDPRLPGTAEAGIEAMQRYYIFIIKEMWYEVFLDGGALPSAPLPPYPLHFVQLNTTFNQNPTLAEPDAVYRQTLQDFYALDLRSAMNNPAATGLDTFAGIPRGAILEMEDSGRWDVDVILREKGWAGAAIWYNRVAEMNGNVISAVLNIPMPTRYPRVMESVYAQKRQQEKSVTFKERFKPVKASGQGIDSEVPVDGQMAQAYWAAFDYWQQGDNTTTPHSTPTGNAVIDILNGLLGTEGLFDMRRNPDVHPLAQLTGIGRSLIEGAIRNLTYAAVGGAGGAALAQVSEFFGTTAAVFSGFMLTFALLSLTVGFVLFYVVPLLPFIYFFFAVSGWVKGIFEAMVGAPLWALAHIRIHGEGLAGPAAVSGYFLIFEIFLRPILMVFGLLASISIFSALVSVLNQIFDLVVSNTGGFDVNAEFTGVGASKMAYMRSSVDEFFYTAIYALIVYLMGMSSFKLIDHIPNQILRWMGQSVKTFNDGREDAAGSLVGTSTVGMQQLTSTVGQPLKQLASMGKK
ncbi:MAG: DotA/TraY family protein [Alphaproteobacteria bacterium]|nr:DotA/TraY family protein [Alphaproteobacteria bacterium]